MPIPSHRPLPEPIKEKSSSKKKKTESKSTKSKTKSKSKKEKKPEDNFDLWLKDPAPEKSENYIDMPSGEYEDMNKKKLKKTKGKEKKIKSKRTKDKQGGLLVEENHNEEGEVQGSLWASPVPKSNRENGEGSSSNHNNNNALVNGFPGDVTLVPPKEPPTRFSPLGKDDILKLVSLVRPKMMIFT